MTSVRTIGPVLAVALAIAGCAGPQPLKPKMSEELSSILAKEGFQIHIPASDRPRLRGDGNLDGSLVIQQGQSMALGLNSAAQGAANSGAPGGGPAAAGVVIGTLLVAAMSQAGAEEQREAESQQRIAPLLQLPLAQQWQEWFGQTYRDAFASAGHPGSPNAALELHIAPQINLSRDLRSIRLGSEFKLLHGKGSLYEGRIETLSEPISRTDCLQSWAANDGALLHDAVRQAASESVRVLLLDWQTHHFQGLAGNERTINYQVGDDRFVERGRPLQVDSPRPLFLTLRGWVKSIPTQSTR
jgi:hypothetical protein